MTDYVFFDGVLLEFEVVVGDGLSHNNLIVILRVMELLQEWMFQDLSGGEAHGGVVDEECADEIDGGVRGRWD